VQENTVERAVKGRTEKKLKRVNNHTEGGGDGERERGRAVMKEIYEG